MCTPRPYPAPDQLRRSRSQKNPVSSRRGWRARSASRSGSEGHFANRRSLTSTAPAVHIGLRVPAENTPRTRTAGALRHNPAIMCRKRQSERIARVNAQESAHGEASTTHRRILKDANMSPRQQNRCVYPHDGAFSFALYEKVCVPPPAPQAIEFPASRSSMRKATES